MRAIVKVCIVGHQGLPPNFGHAGMTRRAGKLALAVSVSRRDFGRVERAPSLSDHTGSEAASFKPVRKCQEKMSTTASRPHALRYGLRPANNCDREITGPPAEAIHV